MSLNGQVPFVDLVTPHRELEDELVAVFRSALRTAGFIGGPMVDGFERDFAQFCETNFCIGVSSGTDALRFALMAAGVEPQSIVITVPNTFIATAEAISQAGARPDFVDVDPATYTMDPEKLRSHALDMVTLFNSSTIDSEMEADLIRGILDSGGIPSILTNIPYAGLLGVEVKVPRGKLKEAEALIAEAKAAGPEAAAEAEAASEG